MLNCSHLFTESNFYHYTTLHRQLISWLLFDMLSPSQEPQASIDKAVFKVNMI